MNKGNKAIKLLETKNVYSGKVLLRRDKILFKNKIIEKEVVEHPRSVGVIPIIASTDIILVFQYRYAIGKRLLEIPAGKIEIGESPEQAALREMAEEIGYTGNVKPFIRLYLSPGYATEMMNIFIATDLKKVERGNLDDDELIIVRKVKLTTAVKNCYSGHISDCKTIAALLAYEHYLNEKI